jgi:formate dehydrogenase accessory protein FdhD
MPEPERIAHALARIGLRVHSDIVLTKQMLVDPADTVYVLPARTRYEQQGGGTETSTERRVIFSPYVPGHDIGEARAEFEMLAQFARAVKPQGAERLGLDDSAAIRRDIARAVPAYAGIERLAKQGDQFQWGGPRLCEGRRCGRTRRASCREPPQLDRAAPEGGPLRLSAARRAVQLHGPAPAYPITGADRTIFIAPADAQRLGIRQDDVLHLQSPPAASQPGLHNRRGAGRCGHWPEVNGLIAPGVVATDGGVPDYNATVTVLREDRRERASVAALKARAHRAPRRRRRGGGDVVVEDPRVRLGKQTLLVTLRTPGRDLDLVRGMLFNEGLVARPEDVAAVAHCADVPRAARGNVVTVALRRGAKLNKDGTLRVGLVTSACGTCGRAVVDTVGRDAPRIVGGPTVTLAVLAGLPAALRTGQDLFTRTGGLHAAALFDARPAARPVAEDVGRHNAVDKVIGEAARWRLPLRRNHDGVRAHRLRDRPQGAAGGDPRLCSILGALQPGGAAGARGGQTLVSSAGAAATSTAGPREGAAKRRRTRRG